MAVGWVGALNLTGVACIAVSWDLPSMPARLFARRRESMSCRLLAVTAETGADTQGRRLPARRAAASRAQQVGHRQQQFAALERLRQHARGAQRQGRCDALAGTE